MSLHRYLKTGSQRNAFNEGYNTSVECDGVLAGSPDNPYPEGTPEHVAWRRGWNEHFDMRWMN